MGNRRNVDVVVIGAGTAGLSAYAVVKRKTDSVLIVDDGPLGTTCARTGCMPSKALIEVARDLERAHRSLLEGLTSGEVHANAPAIMRRVRELRDRFVAGPARIGTDPNFVAGRAKFTGPGRLQIGDLDVRARRVVIATGTSPIIPGEWRAFGDRVLTSETIFELRHLPTTCAVVGAGPLGLELAQAMTRLGCRVDTFGTSPNFGGLTDPTVQRVARDVLGPKVGLHVGDPAKPAPAPNGVVVSSGDVSRLVDRVLVTVGRRANTENLGLENIGVEVDERGVPDFDPATMELRDAPGVFIAGDVAGDRPVMHEATFEGKLAGANAIAERPGARARYPRLAITFTDPNVCVVGETFATLDGQEVATGEVDFGDQGRARVMNEAHGILRIYGDPATGRLRGAEMVCPGGEHLAHILAFAVARGATASEMLDLPIYHPTLEEGLRTALVELVRKSRD